MGYIFDVISELNRMEIATEADDITGQTEKDTNSAMGKKSTNIDEGAPDDSSNDGEIDTDTDDILGTDDNDEDTSDTATNDDGTDESTEEDDMDDTDDGSTDDISDEELDDTMEEEENPFESSRKKKIHKQFINFYDVITSNIELISEFMPRVADEKSIQILNSVKNHLTQCKEYAYTILTEEYNVLEYPALLKKYVALNRVYDLSIKILEKYYEKYDAENQLKKAPVKK